MRLFGWDADTWQRALKWAKAGPLAIWDETNFRALLGVRRRWLEAGGPLSGPSGKLVL